MVGGVCGVLVGGCEGGETGEGVEGCVARNALGAVQKLSLKYVCINVHIHLLQWNLSVYEDTPELRTPL